MPQIVRILCIVLSALLIVHACLAPFVEEHWWFLLPVTVDAGSLWLLWAFAHRYANTLSWLTIYCIVAVIFDILFSPFSSEYGQWGWLVQSQFVAEAMVCVALFFALQMQSTKSWFNDVSEAESAQ
jgi:hypothetical protein